MKRVLLLLMIGFLLTFNASAQISQHVLGLINHGTDINVGLAVRYQFK